MPPVMQPPLTPPPPSWQMQLAKAKASSAIVPAADGIAPGAIVPGEAAAVAVAAATVPPEAAARHPEP